MGPAEPRPLLQAARVLAELVERRVRSPVISRWWLSAEPVGGGGGQWLCVM